MGNNQYAMNNNILGADKLKDSTMGDQRSFME